MPVKENIILTLIKMVRKILRRTVSVGVKNIKTETIGPLFEYSEDRAGDL